jgi:hypothetical protein
MSDASTIVVVEESGSHLLLRRGHDFAVLERRNGKLYDPHHHNLAAFADTQVGMAAAVGRDWSEEATARRAFAAIVEREEDLARRIR